VNLWNIFQEKSLPQHFKEDISGAFQEQTQKDEDEEKDQMEEEDKANEEGK